MWRIRFYTFLTITAFGILYLFTGIMIIIGMPVVFLRLKGAVRFLMRLWAKSVFLIIGKKLHVEGMGKIEKNGKYILIANHSSLFDIIAITSFFPGVSWFGHERLLKIPVFRQILKMTDYVPMKKASIKNTKEMVDQLIKKSKGHTIAMFPEGTRTLDGKVNEFYRGFIHVLRASEINVLPVTLNGFYILKPKNRFYINFSSKISVIIHEPILRELLLDKNDSEIVDIVKNIIESSMVSQQVSVNICNDHKLIKI
jgi:1-acyl-sn-glycerol-3-phosphate acyltransferase